MKKPPKAPSSNDKTTEHKTPWEVISKPVTIVCIIVTALLAVVAYYHTQQKEVWEGRLNHTKEQLDACRQEVEKVKQDLKVCAERESKEVPKAQERSGGPAGRTIRRLMKSETPIPVAENLSMTLIELAFQPKSATYSVTAKVVYKDLPEMQIRDAQEGYIVTYPKEHGYTIELLKADAVSAKFSITKNP
ncbi:MAG: hypothetical protein AABO41_22140 [Acidobacteriota bacterium]